MAPSSSSSYFSGDGEANNYTIYSTSGSNSYASTDDPSSFLSSLFSNGKRVRINGKKIKIDLNGN